MSTITSEDAFPTRMLIPPSVPAGTMDLPIPLTVTSGNGGIKVDGTLTVSRLTFAESGVGTIGAKLKAAPTGRVGERELSIRRQLVCGLVAMELEDAAAVQRLVERSALLIASTSFGGMHTSVDRRARWGDPVGDGFARISLGIEDTDDLIADFEEALA